MSARTTLSAAAACGLALALACACTPPPPSTSAPETPTPAAVAPAGSGSQAVTPTPTPQRASENPEDVRARMRLRPTPFEAESKFPPPQQSEEEEARTANRPGEPDLLHGEPAVFLDGAPFPEKTNYEPKFPEARRLRYVSADASGAGDGTLQHPWKDLQEALCRLEPGDRLVVAAGIYAGAFRVGEGCRDGTADAPIQVFARHAFLKSGGGGDVLTVERSHWQFWEMQIALLDSEVAGFVATGPGAHDLAVDQSHIYEGRGPAVRVEAGASRITLSNCHIHQSTGVRIDAGASEITLVNNHVHHNRAASITVGGGGDSAPARGISIVGNRLHNDRGPAVELSHCERVTLVRNRLSNYRPDEDDGKGGEAVWIRSGSRDVTFEDGSILEATVAVRVGDAEKGPAPHGIVFRRTYFQNQLTPESTALLVERAEDVRFHNNVLDRYAEPFRIGGPGVSGVMIANDLVLRPSRAFSLQSPEAIALFDYDVFGGPPTLEGLVAGRPVSAADWIRGHMPHSALVGKLDIEGSDLGRVAGFSPVDAGTPLDGLAFKGRAPDIGVAEH